MSSSAAGPSQRTGGAGDYGSALDEEPDGFPPPASDGDLVQAGARGAAWLGIASIVGKVMLAATTIVLARLLTPEEFGLISLSLVMIVYADAISDAGVGQAMIYLPRTRESTRAAFVCSLVSGLVLAGLVWLGAPLVADFFHRPDVTPLVRLLGVGLLASALAAVPEALLRRELLFSRNTVAYFIRSLVTGGVAIVLAFLGAGAWSLAIGTVSGSVAYLVAAWVLCPQRPDARIWRTTRQDIRTVWGYGIPVAGSTLLSRLIFDVDYLIIGRVLGATALGYYTLAFRLPELLIINVFFILTGVAFPIYSQVRNNAERLSSGYLVTVRIFSLYGLTAGVGLAVGAALIVPAFFGEQWEASVMPLVALGLYAACRSIGGGATEIYKAIGRPGLSVWLSLIRLAVLVPSLYVAARLWGIVGVAWMQVATSLLFAVLMQAVAVRTLGLRWGALGREMLPALVASAAVAVVGWPLAHLPLPPLAALAVLVLGGLVAAVVALRAIFPRVLADLLSVVRRRSPAAA
jgi:lipopolysaccharide exporter